MAKIVIIDDEAPILDLMTKLCRKMGHEPFAYQTGREGLSALPALRPDLVIVDLRIGDMNGLQVIEKCRRDFPNINVVMVTGFGSVETAVEAMKLGAFDYLTKPFELDDLQRTLNRALSHRGGAGTSGTATSSKSGESLELTPTTLVGQSPQMKEILRLVERIANNDSPALLEGEFGSGKQMLARTIHDRSRRREAPFKVLYSGALPEDLLEQELFGGTAGTQTIFQRAHGGTVVVEEIHHLPLRLQSQLTTFLEALATRRMRNAHASPEDFRFIATSSQPLEKLMKEGKFREDLYYKISVVPIHIPPLRNRRDDIELLAYHFLRNYAQMTGSPVEEIDRYGVDLLKGYAWPGNVGELQNAIERACTFAEGKKIRPVDLPPKITQKVEVSDLDNLVIKHQLPIGSTLDDYIRKQERMFIRETLKYNEGSREKTASMLGVSIATLYRKMGLKLERDKVLQ
ncbi:MAG: sigma-54-dependent transcriptional regulator [Verrucomicrobiales bacterium]